MKKFKSLKFVNIKSFINQNYWNYLNFLILFIKWLQLYINFKLTTDMMENGGILEVYFATFYGL